MQGSYAGARAAHMRVLYPDLVYGAIASSGVTHASISNWEYMEIIRNAADPKCSKNLVESVKAIDYLLETKFRTPLKQLFGLGELEHDVDFVSLISVSRSLYLGHIPSLILRARILLERGKAKIGTQR